MAEFDDCEKVRPMLARLCVDDQRRLNPPSPEIVHQRWRPFTVKDPATLSLLTDKGAWEFIADQLRLGAPITYQGPSQEFPDHAYVMLESGGGSKNIYMKIAVRRGLSSILGISFHYERFPSK